MKAAVLSGIKNLEITKVDRPTCNSGDILINITTNPLSTSELWRCFFTSVIINLIGFKPALFQPNIYIFTLIFALAPDSIVTFMYLVKIFNLQCILSKEGVSFFT